VFDAGLQYTYGNWFLSYPVFDEKMFSATNQNELMHCCFSKR
jgi:hypothetical protein